MNDQVTNLFLIWSAGLGAWTVASILVGLLLGTMLRRLDRARRTLARERGFWEREIQRQRQERL